MATSRALAPGAHFARTSLNVAVPSGVRTLPRMIVTRVGGGGGPRVQGTREYREEDDSIVVPGDQPTTSSSTNSNGAIFADQVQMPRKKQSGNLSKEMKAKLRAEYTGWGGAENSGGIPRRLIVAAVTRVDEEQQTSTSSTVAPKVGSSKFVIDPNENLKSTWEHRLWTWTAMGLMGGTFWQSLNQASTPSDYAVVALTFAAAYVLSDLGTGIYHWGVDNYGSGKTPVFGRQIAAFQGHHQRPWTITEREFCNNVHQVFKPAAVPAAAFLAASPWMPFAWNAFASSFLFMVCMSQQFHAWSHMKKSELNPIVVALQDANILISRKMHGAHHRAPFEGNYCIVSGLWNPLLDSTSFFRAMEQFFFERTGVEPRCWNDVQDDWKELERPADA